jgi:carbamoyl-phosphate synthase large subunit
MTMAASNGFNVLLTSVGRRVALVRAFQAELRGLFPGGYVFGADASRRSGGFHAADQGFVVPRCTDPQFVPALLDLVREHRIRLLVPLIDTELLVLARHREWFQELGCVALVSDERLVAITRDKRETAACFAGLGFRVPRVFSESELERPEELPYPLFLKPAAGSSSIGATRVDSAEELRFFSKRVKDPVIQTLERGEEFTIDVFADLAGHARCAVPRRRWETRGGEISKGRTVRDPVLISASKRLVDALRGCRGCVTLQCFRDPTGEPVFFEANLRFGGGYPLSYAAGANYPRWAIELAAGGSIPEFDGWRDAVVMLRYDDAVFLEGDPG